MKQRIHSRKGSSAVFLTCILAALIAIVLTLIYGVRTETVKSRTDGLLDLAGNSVMSEFHYELQKEYGLFLIRGTDRQLSRKLQHYLNYSLEGMGGVEVQKLAVSGSRFSVLDLELVKEQILAYMKYAKAQGLLDQLTGKSKPVEIPEKSEAGRVLQHGPTKVSLPSAELPDKSLITLAESIADRAGNAGQAFSEGAEDYLINGYILGCFNNRTQSMAADHFFRSEVEYILGGKVSDEKNEQYLERALKAMRVPLNLAHIYADPEKRAAVLAAAELITPGAAAAATQLALATTWAYAEADNDVELLWQGYKVPMRKDATTWAIDLNNAMEGLTGGTIRPKVERGYDYRQYLQILLFFQDETIKLARILDLI